MPLHILAFLFGDLYLQTFSERPTIIFICSLIIFSPITIIFLRNKIRYAYFPLVFTAGFLWSFYYANNILAWTLSHEMEGKPLLISGYISSLPLTDQFGTRFEFKINELIFENKHAYPHALIRLSSRATQTLTVGDEWKFLVKLKRIHGMRSPGAFDFEAWALQKGIRANGYILESPNNILLAHEVWAYPIARLRQVLQNKIHDHVPQTPTSPWLTALIIGERNGIAQNDWQVLRNTGTNHLMAIAGLHIGIIAGLTHFIISWLWRRIPRLVLIIPATQIGACAALIIASLYSAISGFSLPAQRACIMLSVFILCILYKRKINPWIAWSLALFCVLILNPLSVLTESFWLSFSTIALIIFGMHGRLSPSGIWWKWGRVQWVIAIGLIPMTLALFQQCSLVSFIANSIAIPWLGFCVLPFCFLSSIFLLIAPSIAHVLLLIADKSLSYLWEVLAWMAQLHLATWNIVIPNYLYLFLMIMGCIFLLLPIGTPGKWLGWIWILPVLFYQPAQPKEGDVWLALLDVGQGLSVIVQTKNHLLVYDAGPSSGDHFDTGESIVTPYLNTIAAKKIDKLVISHGDNDHIGGAQALIRAFTIHDIQTSVPEKFLTHPARHCLAGEKWQWDDVQFTFLYPTEDMLKLGNDSSCVLRIDNGAHVVLLTGDIEKHAEKILLTGDTTLLKTDIVIAPHHGSKTSGLNNFILAMQPKIVLYAIGYRNRYHFPHQSVVHAYEEINTLSYNTVESGTIQFKLEKGKSLFIDDQYRISHKKYWH